MQENTKCKGSACYDTPFNMLKQFYTKSKSLFLSKSILQDSNGYIIPPYPPTQSEIGKSTWTLLHTIASNYPTNPNKLQQTAMIQLLEALSILYPCVRCRTHLSNYMKDHQIQSAIFSRALLTKYMCDLHNDINKKLGKPLFNYNLYLNRWYG